MRDVDEGVPAEHPPPVRGQGEQVLVERGRHQVGLGAGHPGDQRGFLDDPAHLADLLGEPRQRAVAGASAGPAGGLLHGVAQRALGGVLLQPFDVDALVGAGQQRLAREVADLVAVGGDARGDGGLAAVLRGAVVPAGDPDAGHEPAQVPLPAAGVGLVEVVEVHHEVALG